jgi:hypothetical protein
VSLQICRGGPESAAEGGGAPLAALLVPPTPTSTATATATRTATPTSLFGAGVPSASATPSSSVGSGGGGGGGGGAAAAAGGLPLSAPILYGAAGGGAVLCGACIAAALLIRRRRRRSKEDALQKKRAMLGRGAAGAAKGPRGRGSGADKMGKKERQALPDDGEVAFVSNPLIGDARGRGGAGEAGAGAGAGVGARGAGARGAPAAGAGGAAAGGDVVFMSNPLAAGRGATTRRVGDAASGGANSVLLHNEDATTATPAARVLRRAPSFTPTALPAARLRQGPTGTDAATSLPGSLAAGGGEGGEGALPSTEPPLHLAPDLSFVSSFAASRDEDHRGERIAADAEEEAAGAWDGSGLGAGAAASSSVAPAAGGVAPLSIGARAARDSFWAPSISRGARGAAMRSGVTLTASAADGRPPLAPRVAAEVADGPTLRERLSMYRRHARGDKSPAASPKSGSASSDEEARGNFSENPLHAAAPGSGAAASGAPARGAAAAGSLSFASAGPYSSNAAVRARGAVGASGPRSAGPLASASASASASAAEASGEGELSFVTSPMRQAQGAPGASAVLSQGAPGASAVLSQRR